MGKGQGRRPTTKDLVKKKGRFEQIEWPDRQTDATKYIISVLC